MRFRTALFTMALALLLGCAGDRPAAAQPTLAPNSPRPTTAATTTSSKPAASPAAAARTVLPTGSAAQAPAVKAAGRAQLGPGSPAIRLDPYVGSLTNPVAATHAADGSGRLFVVEKPGRIRIVRGGALAPTPYLDITSMVRSGGSEQGLLGLAFHPRYAENGLFFVNYIDHTAVGNSVVARYQVRGDNPDLADPNSAQRVLYVEQPFSNHNGGHLAFGPDGYLYIGLGDGGSGGDPRGNAQNKGALLGKMLRIDVDSGTPYGIPADNPFVNEPGTRPEIWAYGLRNPWRYSFDRATGDFYIADVGQNAWEWVHLQRAGQPGGTNYGWNVVEGSHCYSGQGCNASAYPKPVAEYPHSLGCSITGGYVYRGASFPELAGLYFYGDYCSGRMWGLQEQPGGEWRSEQLLQVRVSISSFGEDEAGELYVTGLTDGKVYRLVAAR